MMLIADSGSTKTQWCILSDHTAVQTCTTAGINPFYQDASQITETLAKEFTLCHTAVAEIYFYGAGCANEEKQNIVRKGLSTFFDCTKIVVGSDLLAAARSLCQTQKGIACILGTGSNSCFYDGKNVAHHISPLGFILGDEGSGAAMGKRLIGDLLKNQLPAGLRDQFLTTFQTTPAEILNQVYQKPFPNRYLAGFTRFVAANLHHPQLEALVVSGFKDFIVRNVLQYPEANHLPIHFTGSIAWHFKPQLIAALQEYQLHPGQIVANPMEGLIQYHRQIAQNQ